MNKKEGGGREGGGRHAGWNKWMKKEVKEREEE